MPTSATVSVSLEYVESPEQYSVQFVYSYYGTFNVVSGENIEKTGERRISISAFSNAILNYTLNTPNIGGKII